MLKTKVGNKHRIFSMGHLPKYERNKIDIQAKYKIFKVEFHWLQQWDSAFPSLKAFWILVFIFLIYFYIIFVIFSSFVLKLSNISYIALQLWICVGLFRTRNSFDKQILFLFKWAAVVFVSFRFENLETLFKHKTLACVVSGLHQLYVDPRNL